MHAHSTTSTCPRTSVPSSLAVLSILMDLKTLLVLVYLIPDQLHWKDEQQALPSFFQNPHSQHIMSEEVNTAHLHINTIVLDL